MPIDWALSHYWRSLTQRQAEDALSRRPNSLPSGGLMVFYARDYCSVRMDAEMDGPKFITPSRHTHGPARPYVPPLEDPSVWSDPSVPLVFVEGPVKAVALTLAGFPAIGLSGCTGGGHNKQKRDDQGILELHALLLQHVRWQGRQVAIMLDSDAWTKPQVRHGEDLLAPALVAAGAVPFIARTPPGPNGEKQGPDDFLMACGHEAVRAHLSRATLWVPPPPRVRRGPSWSPARCLQMMDALAAALPPGARLQARELYRAYAAWCSARGLPVLSLTMFSRRLPTLGGFRRTKSKGKVYWTRSSSSGGR